MAEHAEDAAEEVPIEIESAVLGSGAGFWVVLGSGSWFAVARRSACLLKRAASKYLQRIRGADGSVGQLDSSGTPHPDEAFVFRMQQLISNLAERRLGVVQESMKFTRVESIEPSATGPAPDRAARRMSSQNLRSLEAGDVA